MTGPSPGGALRITVIGAGAMGSVFGGALARAGHAVTLFDRRRDHVEAVRASGLRVTGVPGDVTVRVGATADAGDLGPADLALVLVESASTAAAAEVAAGVLGPEGVALTLQNGIGNVEALVARLGPGRVLGGTTYTSAALAGPGHSRHTNRGETWIGEPAGGRSDRVERLRDVLEEAGFETHASANVMGHVWSKFVLNGAIGPVSAVTGLRPGEIARNADAAALLASSLDEILAVVAAKGVVLPEADPRAHVLEHCRLRYNRPSMLQHVEAGRATEIEALSGALVAEAGALGLDAPVTDALRLAVHAIEARRRRELSGVPVDEAALEAAARAEG